MYLTIWHYIPEFMTVIDLVILFHNMVKLTITSQVPNYIVNAPEFVIKYNLSIVSSGHSSFCYILYIQLDLRYDYNYSITIHFTLLSIPQCCQIDASREL